MKILPLSNENGYTSPSSEPCLYGCPPFAGVSLFTAGDGIHDPRRSVLQVSSTGATGSWRTVLNFTAPEQQAPQQRLAFGGFRAAARFWRFVSLSRSPTTKCAPLAACQLYLAELEFRDAQSGQWVRNNGTVTASPVVSSSGAADAGNAAWKAADGSYAFAEYAEGWDSGAGQLPDPPAFPGPAGRGPAQLLDPDQGALRPSPAQAPQKQKRPPERSGGRLSPSAARETAAGSEELGQAHHDGATGRLTGCQMRAVVEVNGVLQTETALGAIQGADQRGPGGAQVVHAVVAHIRELRVIRISPLASPISDRSLLSWAGMTPEQPRFAASFRLVLAAHHLSK